MVNLHSSTEEDISLHRDSTILNFNELYSQLDIDEYNKQVERNRSALENDLPYLKKYQISYAKKSMLDVFDEYILIGRGQYGDVFNVSDKDGNNYVFKRIKMFGDKEKDEKMMREVKVHGKLKHENIVNFYEYWIEMDNPHTLWLYLFMELCVESLADYFKKKVLIEKFDITSYLKDIKMAKQICNGLKFIHTQKIIHRDLKPENILIDSCGICKIADFGLSTFHKIIVESAVYTGEHTIGEGTLLYAAPEQLNIAQKKPNFYFYFKSEQDRKNFLLQLRNHKLPNFKRLPDSVENNNFHQYDIVKKMILTMTNIKPKFRPTLEKVDEKIDTILKNLLQTNVNQSAKNEKLKTRRIIRKSLRKFISGYYCKKFTFKRTRRVAIVDPIKTPIEVIIESPREANLRAQIATIELGQIMCANEDQIKENKLMHETMKLKIEEKEQSFHPEKVKLHRFAETFTSIILDEALCDLTKQVTKL